MAPMCDKKRGQSICRSCRWLVFISFYFIFSFFSFLHPILWYQSDRLASCHTLSTSHKHTHTLWVTAGVSNGGADTPMIVERSRSDPYNHIHILLWPVVVKKTNAKKMAKNFSNISLTDAWMLLNGEKWKENPSHPMCVLDHGKSKTDLIFGPLFRPNTHGRYRYAVQYLDHPWDLDSKSKMLHGSTTQSRFD